MSSGNFGVDLESLENAKFCNIFNWFHNLSSVCFYLGNFS